MTDYITYVDQLVAEDKSSGQDQSEAMVHYTALSLKRMQRWSKTGKLSQETVDTLKKVSSPQKWVLLTESWCGDAAHAYPFIKKMAESSDQVELEWKLRDDNLDLMDQYLTNGGRSIPKLIAYDANGNELFNWGPRPEHIQDTFLTMKAAGKSKDEMMLELQKLYNQDRGSTTQKELINLIETTL